MEEILKAFPVVVEIPIAWGDMDALQHVNNVMYFRYFESSRAAYLAKIRIWQMMEETGVGPILASTHCRYKIPLTYPDTVSVGTRVTKIGKDRFTMEHTVVSHHFGKVAAEGDAVLVTYDYRAGRKALVPEELKNTIATLESGTGWGSFLNA